MTQRFFGDGTITAAAFDAAETVARVEIEAIAGAFGAGAWREAYALVRHRGGAGRHPRAERILGRGDHAARARAAAPAHARRRPRLPPEAQCAEGGTRAGAGRWLRDHGGGRRASSDRAHRSGGRRAAARRALRPAGAHDRRGCPPGDRRAIHRALRHRSCAGASRGGAGRHALPARACPTPIRRSRSWCDGRPAARDRDVDVPCQLSQARRLHPAERRHAGILGRRAGPAGAPRLRLPRRSREGRERARRPADSRGGARRASRRAGPSRALDHRRAAHQGSRSRGVSVSAFRSAGSPRIR